MKISDRDWMQLSALLDGELSPNEQEKIQHRIEVDPALASAFRELQRTKAVLRTTPRLRIPRNFTLKPEQLGIRHEPERVHQRYRLAAVLLTVALVGVMVLDFGRLLVGGGLAPAMAPRSEEVLMEAVSDEAAGDAEEPDLVVPEGETNQVERSGESAQELPAEEEVAEAPAVAAEESDQAPDALEAEQTLPKSETEEKHLGESEEQPAEVHEQPEGMQIQATAVEETQTGFVEEQPQPGAVEPLPEDEEPEVWSAADLDLIRILEIILGVGVIGFGFAAWKRRRRK
jgi:anti-sigma factor RsiW